ncbi:MAG: asparagine synthase B [Streptococcaceae bacterium]|jgi:asparagine synthase (glutamine-hydrolysing)|nr:asparagine synthase B [Streptococcaceae bacterium]
MCGFVFSSNTSLEKKTFFDNFERLIHRGPDDAEILTTEAAFWGFHRLAIMDLSNAGNQPFIYKNKELMCNGEIYNCNELRKFLKPHYSFHSTSDCEVLLPLFEQVGIESMVRMLDAEFAFVIADNQTKKIWAARDPFGIRPLFYGYDKKNKKIAFASEAKGLVDWCEKIMPFPPGHYYANGEFHLFNDVGASKLMIEQSLDTLCKGIRWRLKKAVIKRLHSDAPIGFLLSGGLDSSLVCAIAQKYLDKPIETFAIGMENDPIDLKYAKEVADFLGTHHHEITMSKEEVLKVVEEVIYHLETWDITTIRASIGMYLIAKYIHKKTNIKALLTGEVSDEMFGYKYTDFAPNAFSFQKEAQKRVRELYMYDVLRADRTLAAHSLEARVPFADLDFANYVMSINPARKINTYGQGKYLLRHAFDTENYLPHDILFREKAAFSDAVGHSMVDYLKEHAEKQYSNSDLLQAKKEYPTHTPFTKESLWYRDIFEKFYPGNDNWIIAFWMPKKQWVGEKVNDPSARVLKNYGNSGK